jgi:peptidoglycan/xylan/chitin deacetylase (PgdA/CDA1 family)
MFGTCSTVQRKDDHYVEEKEGLTWEVLDYCARYCMHGVFLLLGRCPYSNNRRGQLQHLPLEHVLSMSLSVWRSSSPATDLPTYLPFFSRSFFDGHLCRC